MGSIELVKPRGELIIGSVAQAVAKRSDAHVCIVKNFSTFAA